MIWPNNGSFSSDLTKLTMMKTPIEIVWREKSSLSLINAIFVLKLYSGTVTTESLSSKHWELIFQMAQHIWIFLKSFNSNVDHHISKEAPSPSQLHILKLCCFYHQVEICEKSVAWKEIFQKNGNVTPYFLCYIWISTTCW